jgi:hypothetical protein
MNWSETGFTIGVDLLVPTQLEGQGYGPASQVISTQRWDAADNKITGYPFSITMCMPGVSGTPLFYRYDDDSNIPHDILAEGGSVGQGSPLGCYDVNLVRTSSLVAFALDTSPSPSPASPSSSPGTATVSPDGSDWALWLLFLVVPGVVLLGIGAWIARKKVFASSRTLTDVTDNTLHPTVAIFDVVPGFPDVTPTYAVTPTYPESPTYATYAEIPTYPTYPESPTYPTYPESPTYPTYPESPTYPTYPARPTYTEIPTYPTNPESPTDPTYPESPTYPTDHIP